MPVSMSVNHHAVYISCEINEPHPLSFVIPTALTSGCLLELGFQASDLLLELISLMLTLHSLLLYVQVDI